MCNTEREARVDARTNRHMCREEQNTKGNRGGGGARGGGGKETRPSKHATLQYGRCGGDQPLAASILAGLHIIMDDAVPVQLKLRAHNKLRAAKDVARADRIARAAALLPFTAFDDFARSALDMQHASPAASVVVKLATEQNFSHAGAGTA